MDSRERIIALIVSCALFMQSVDSTILGTSLTTIAESFGTDPVRLHTTMTTYLLSLAVFMPLSGWLADKYGTRAIFRAAIAVFVGASVACAFARNLEALVAARIVQGAGGAMMVPVARLALLRSVPKDRLIAAMAWVSIPALVGPLIGPPLGGFIVTYASWPWIFWINLPIGILGIVLATIFMPDLREPDVARLDGVGFLLVALGVSGLVLGFETIADGILPVWVNWLAIALGLAGLVGYWRHARRAVAPIIDLSLLSVSTFHAGVVGGSIFRVGIGAIPFLLPLTLQAGFGYSPLASGLTTVAAAAGALTMKFGVQRIISRFGFRKVLVWNAMLSAVSVAACALFSPGTPVWVIVLVLLAGGFFRSLEFTALNAVAYADLDQRRMSRATAFASMAQQLSLSIGVGVAALSLHLLRSAGLSETNTFLAALALIGLVIASAALVLARLPAGAGAEVAQGPVAAVGGAARPPSDPRI